MEYFSFINLFLLFLFIIIMLFFILISSTLLYYSNVNFNHCLVEFISTLFSLLFLIIIISPALIILLDFDLIILPTINIYSLGLQWAWQFNIIFLPINIGFNSYCDHYIISSNNSIINFNSSLCYLRFFVYNWSLNDCWLNYFSINSFLLLLGYLPINTSHWLSFDYWLLTIHQPLTSNTIINDNNYNLIIKLPFYLWDINSYILLPIYSFIRLFVYSFDVIHTLGFYSWGIKIDAIPGRINLTTTLRLLYKGEYQGKCFELCGQGHFSMIMLSLVSFFLLNILYL
jgi:heme/copper-type cytochrome/quinol oxidase subunit 2